jgi:hypothetical protein
MNSTDINFASSYVTIQHIANHVKLDHDIAIVGPPGCGITTFTNDIIKNLKSFDVKFHLFDLRTLKKSDVPSELSKIPLSNGSKQALLIDHSNDILEDERKMFFETFKKAASNTKSVCIWCGTLDIRSINNNLNIKLNSLPSTHITYSSTTRDELLNVYRIIAERNNCRWGEAILYLLFDFCGNDLKLVNNATQYFYGNWSEKLYDLSVWDTMNKWLKEDETIDMYRKSLNSLPTDFDPYISLLRFGGKPICARENISEETDDLIRFLCINGFLIPNLLPGYYQTRNLVIKYLLDESTNPEILFRRATNERIGQLLQDIENMIRQITIYAARIIGYDGIRKILESSQLPNELLPNELFKLLMGWSKENTSEEGSKKFTELFTAQRNMFREKNTVWHSVSALMRKDNISSEKDNADAHIQCIEYLTFNELGLLLTKLLSIVFPNAKESTPNKLKTSWTEGISRIRRIRNQVAHHRNVSFQDTEDLLITINSMRQDIFKFGAWHGSN